VEEGFGRWIWKVDLEEGFGRRSWKEEKVKRETAVNGRVRERATRWMENNLEGG
jgi:hypothetical protein